MNHAYATAKVKHSTEEQTPQQVHTHNRTPECTRAERGVCCTRSRTWRTFKFLARDGQLWRWREVWLLMLLTVVCVGLSSAPTVPTVPQGRASNESLDFHFGPTQAMAVG